MAARETENNAYARFWGDKQRALWYVISNIPLERWDTNKITKLHITFKQLTKVKS